MSTVLRRLLPASLLLAAALVAFAAPGAARSKSNANDVPNEMSSATPPPYRANLQVAFGPFAIGTSRADLDRISGKKSDPKMARVRYELQDGEAATVTFASDKALEINIARPITEKSKAVLSTTDGIRLGAPIGAVLPLYGAPADREPGTGPGYTLYAWRMQSGRSVVFQTFLGRIVQVDLLPPKAYTSGVSVDGGGGTSADDPVAITAPSHDLAVEAEYTWLSRIDCGAAGFRFAFERDIAQKQRRLEAIGLYCADDQRIYFFDVTKVPKGS
ncbi:MAG: hypothetical protein KGM44_02985 [bacterium]|nr:hypothetical protein [bacterium]